MARLGELLTLARLIEPEKVEQALRAQVVWGGRLGTNLIELGCIDLDSLSRALGRQHSMPAALAKHFDRCDAELQKKLPGELARQWTVVPLLEIGTDKKIALAAIDPLPPEALVAIADAMGCAETGIVVSIAAEMRVRYHLERVYQIARSTRYLRSKGKTITPFPQFADAQWAEDSEVENPIPSQVEHKHDVTGRAAVPPPPVNVDDITAALEEALAATATPASDEKAGRERRTYVRTLGDDSPLGENSLARIQIKRLAKAAGTPELQRDAVTLVEATRAIKRSLHRDRVAELVIDSLFRFVPSCDGALLLVIRGDVAIGWKHMSRTTTSLPQTEVAVPLDQGGLVPAAIQANATARGGAGELGNLDQLLLRSLGKEQFDLAIVPIAIADRVMCLIATAYEPDSGCASVEAIAAAAGVAFSRLMRDASR